MGTSEMVITFELGCPWATVFTDGIFHTGLMDAYCARLPGHYRKIETLEDGRCKYLVKADAITFDAEAL